MRDGGRAAHPGLVITPNLLGAEWRIALAAAAGALRSGAACLPHAEIGRRSKRLDEERNETQRLLESDARVLHLPLVRHLSLPTTSRHALGLPATVDACVFDLDGVLAPSDDLHFAAWADALDAFLARRFGAASVHASHYARLSRRADYDEFLHGRPRLEGVRSFLASRGISLPEGSESDPPGAETVNGVANAKNAALRIRLARDGLHAFADSTRYLEDAEHAGLATAVVSPSLNARSILGRAGLLDLVDLVVSGATERTRAIACEQLHIAPARIAALELTDAGVAAAQAAGIGTVIRVADGLGALR